MSKNKGPNAAPVVAADDVAQDVTEQPKGAVADDSSDDLYLAAERELKGESEPEPAAEPEQPEQPEAEPEPVAAKPAEAPQPVAEINPDAEYLYRDKDGNEIRVKGSDAIYLTTQYHRKLQEKHAEIEKYKPLEQRFQHDKGGLARDILLATNPAERLAAVKELLKQDGLTDLAGAIEQRMAQANLNYDPMAAQRALMQQQQQELEQRQRSFEAQQRLQSDMAMLETSIGRKLTAREIAGIDSVYGNYLQARHANPNLQLPTVQQAYKFAVDALRFEDMQKPQANKPKTPTPVERVATRSAKTGPVSADDMFYAAMKEQGIPV